MSPLVVVVHGQPAPQGSKTRMPNGAVVEASKRVRPWRALITDATAQACSAASFTPDRSTPYALQAVFTMARPASHFRSGKHAHLLRDSAPVWPATMPDLDKLLRAALDGLADGGALANDSRVVDITATKTYPGGHLDALDTPGAVLVLWAMG